MSKGRGNNVPTCHGFTGPHGEQVIFRSIRPDDAAIEQAFVRNLSAESRHLRFLSTLDELDPKLLKRLTTPDEKTEAAIVAVIASEDDEGEREIGVARYACVGPDKDDASRCEFAIVVADEWQGTGLARAMMQTLIEQARQHGYQEMIGDILTHNQRMVTFVESLGFLFSAHPDDAGLRRATLPL